uniref:Uncharacterized protein n=1 Tax=Timema cristinae TaxID=61476 RepID=A0A7R9CHQ7_TIMCR|nr:unnamed protein product [Timema cristinae]
MLQYLSDWPHLYVLDERANSPPPLLRVPPVTRMASERVQTSWLDRSSFLQLESNTASTRMNLNAFMNRGYPKALVCSQIDRAQNSRPTTSTGTNNIIPLVTTYHPGLHKLNNLLKTGFPLLQSFTTTQLVSKEPPKVTYKQPANLRNLLVKPKLPDLTIQPEPKQMSGSFPCNCTPCKTCTMYKPTNSLSSNITKINYPIKGHHTCDSEKCDSENLIYQLECNQCQAQYICLTTETLRE